MGEPVEWSKWLGVVKPRQGQHISMVGATGCGKTTALFNIASQRQWVVALGTKPRDATLERMIRNGWTRIHSWEQRPKLTPNRDGRPAPARLLLWPKYQTVRDSFAHPAIFGEALESIFAEGNWTVVADEVGYLAHDLGLDWVLKRLWQQGRSLGVSMLSGTQRPAWVPRQAWSEASHLGVFRLNDRRDIDILRDIGGAHDTEAVRRTIRQLDYNRHQLLWLDAYGGRSAVTVSPKDIPQLGPARRLSRRLGA